MHGNACYVKLEQIEEARGLLPIDGPCRTIRVPRARLAFLRSSRSLSASADSRRAELRPTCVRCSAQSGHEGHRPVRARPVETENPQFAKSSVFNIFHSVFGCLWRSLWKMR